MPFTHVSDAATHIVRTTAHGLIRFDDLAAHLQTLMDAEHDLPASDIGRLVELVSDLRATHGCGNRTALVVSTPVHSGMARVYGALAQKVDPDFAVFRDLGEAEVWLRDAR